jgi:DNA-binding NarL/FixJ family response regulator
LRGLPFESPRLCRGIITAVWSAAAGQDSLGREGLDEIVKHLKRQAQHGSAASRDADGLTPRERQIAAPVSRGESNREIASSLSVSEATIT